MINLHVSNNETETQIFLQYFSRIQVCINLYGGDGWEWLLNINLKTV